MLAPTAVCPSKPAGETDIDDADAAVATTLPPYAARDGGADPAAYCALALIAASSCAAGRAATMSAYAAASRDARNAAVYRLRRAHATKAYGTSKRRSGSREGLVAPLADGAAAAADATVARTESHTDAMLSPPYKTALLPPGEELTDTAEKYVVDDDAEAEVDTLPL